MDVDPLRFLRCVRNGSVIDCNGVRMGFLGWEESDNAPGYGRLMNLPPGSCEVLVTHEAPHGVSTGRDGQPRGSPRISALIDVLQPEFHVFGHLHHLNGPNWLGATQSLGLSNLVASARWHPDARGLKLGCLAVLDTDTQTLTPVTESWLEALRTPTRVSAPAAE